MLPAMNQFGHKTPVRNAAGEIISYRASVVSRVTRGTLDGKHGRDKNKALVVSLCDGDVISLRVKGTRREPLTITADSLYETLLRWSVNRIQLERARKKKVAKEAARARARIASADRRFRRSLRMGSQSSS